MLLLSLIKYLYDAFKSNDHAHLFTGTSPGKRPNQTIIKLSVVSLIAMHKHVYSK